MKSIKEWMREKGMLEDINPNHFAQIMTGGKSTFKIDTALKSKLKARINSVIDDFKKEAEAEGETITDIDILRDIMGIVTMLVTDKTGTIGNARSIGRELNRDPSEQLAQEPR